MRGKILKETKKQDFVRRINCNHLKGGIAQYVPGTGYTGLIGLGDDLNSYAVLKHTFLWGDTWVRCLRCGQTWKLGDPDYELALNFLTRNTLSSAIPNQTAINNVLVARESTKES